MRVGSQRAVFASVTQSLACCAGTPRGTAQLPPKGDKSLPSSARTKSQFEFEQRIAP